MKTIASKTLEPKELVLSEEDKDPKNRKKLGIAAKINAKATADGLFIHNKIVHRNWFVLEMRTKFPNEPAMWHVDKMYPIPNGKQIMVDEPVKPWEIEECQKKSIALKDLGFVHIIVLPDTTLAEALADMGVEIH